MKNNTQLSLSVLVTREEYSEAAAQQQQRKRGRLVLLIFASGAVLIVLGLAGIFFGNRISLSVSASFCLILLGIFLVCYDNFFAPLFQKAAAAHEYDEKEDLRFATNYVFTEQEVSICNGRIDGKLPLSEITCWSETSALFVVTYGRELNLAIPKRLMNLQQCNYLRTLLENKANGTKL